MPQQLRTHPFVAVAVNQYSQRFAVDVYSDVSESIRTAVVSFATESDPARLQAVGQRFVIDIIEPDEVIGRDILYHCRNKTLLVKRDVSNKLVAHGPMTSLADREIRCYHRPAKSNKTGRSGDG